MSPAMHAAPRPRFVTHASLPTLQHGSPAGRPPWRRGYGSYCLKATCDLRDGEGALVGRVMGYDRYLHVQEKVENACRIQVGGMPGVECGPARVTLLTDYRKHCAGEVYFVLDGTATRLL